PNGNEPCKATDHQARCNGSSPCTQRPAIAFQFLPAAAPHKQFGYHRLEAFDAWKIAACVT
uniref:hypothetical protein n=1 Tax=Rhizobium ruizarguesonis TaxID=2081791 RepID=UPI001FDFD14D